MKKTMLFLFTFFMLICCVSKNNTTQLMCPSLDSVLCEFMNKHEKNQVYHINIYRINEKDIVSISNGCAYDKNFVDGYFFFREKLVTYCYYDSRIRKDIIYKENTHLFTDTINGYPEKSSINADFESYEELYHLVSANKITPLDTRYTQEKQFLATDTNIIKDMFLNCMLNNYINNYPSVLYDMRIYHAGKDNYVSITARSHYDVNNDGCFFRNGHMVVIYSTDDVDLSYLLSTDKIIKDKNSLHNYRKAPIDSWIMPYTQTFSLLGKDSVNALYQ